MLISMFFSSQNTQQSSTGCSGSLFLHPLPAACTGNRTHSCTNTCLNHQLAWQVRARHNELKKQPHWKEWQSSNSLDKPELRTKTASSLPPLPELFHRPVSSGLPAPNTQSSLPAKPSARDRSSRDASSLFLLGSTSGAPRLLPCSKFTGFSPSLPALLSASQLSGVLPGSRISFSYFITSVVTFSSQFHPPASLEAAVVYPVIFQGWIQGLARIQVGFARIHVWFTPQVAELLQLF